MAALKAARDSLESLLGTGLEGMTTVGGGCISPAWRVTLRDGGQAFAKTSDVPGLLAEEAHSLATLAAAVRDVLPVGEAHPPAALAGADRGDAPGLRVPAVLAVSPEWLVLEWLEPARAKPGGWRRAGEDLALLHRGTAGGGVAGSGGGGRAGAVATVAIGPAPVPGTADGMFGWDRDNFIGTLPQPNTPTGSWAEFWRERRLRPQAERAAARLGRARLARLDALLDSLDGLLAAGQEEGASLLHGDLWSGNLLMTGEGAALVDPSCFRGHREVDLAMATLFGGVPDDFFMGYETAWPLGQGWEERRAVYQLYYLLVHVNLFGDGYLRGVDEVLGRSWGFSGPGPQIEE